MPEWLEWARFYAVAAILAAGLFFLCAGVFGAYKFRFVLNRMHAAGLIDTLGTLLCMSALIVACGFTFTSAKFFLTVLLLWCTSPVSSHLIARLVVNTEERLDKHMEVKKP